MLQHLRSGDIRLVGGASRVGGRASHAAPEPWVRRQARRSEVAHPALRRLVLGGDTELIAAMQAAEQEAKRKGREEAWEAARQQAGTSAGPLSIPSSAPEKDQLSA